MNVEIKDLYVSVDDKEIVKGLSLSMKGGEVHAIMGPNGSGKSTLSYAIAGHPAYEVKGEVLIDGKNLIELSPDERAREGVFLSFQHPPFVEGVSVFNLLKKAYVATKGLDERDITIYKEFNAKVNAALETLGLSRDFLKRDVNKNFSGGEKKKAEMLQMLVLEPRFILIDEVDSGLDVDALKVVSKAINSLRSPERVFLIITHYNRILSYVEPTDVHVMKEGKIERSGGKELAKEVEEKGYSAGGPVL